MADLPIIVIVTLENCGACNFMRGKDGKLLKEKNPLHFQQSVIPIQWDVVTFKDFLMNSTDKQCYEICEIHVSRTQTIESFSFFNIEVKSSNIYVKRDTYKTYSSYLYNNITEIKQDYDDVYFQSKYIYEPFDIVKERYLPSEMAIFNVGLKVYPSAFVSDRQEWKKVISSRGLFDQKKINLIPPGEKIRQKMNFSEQNKKDNELKIVPLIAIKDFNYY